MGTGTRTGVATDEGLGTRGTGFRQVALTAGRRAGPGCRQGVCSENSQTSPCPDAGAGR